MLHARLAFRLSPAGLAHDQDKASASPTRAYSPDFKTYNWITVGGAEHVDATKAAQIKQAIDAQLAARGLSRTEEKPHLELEYWVEAHAAELTVANGSNMGMGTDGVRSMPKTSLPTETLHVNVYDAASKELVWQGDATKVVDDNVKPEKRQKSIDKAVAKLMKHYPAGKK